MTLAQKLATATPAELAAVIASAGATFKAQPTTKEEAVAKKAMLAALAEAFVRAA
jgi:hypothetical protein